MTSDFPAARRLAGVPVPLVEIRTHPGRATA